VGNITLNQEERAVIQELNNPLYAADCLEKWLNQDDDACFFMMHKMRCYGYYLAVKDMAAAYKHDKERKK
jgi:hypothetical protein